MSSGGKDGIRRPGWFPHKNSRNTCGRVFVVLVDVAHYPTLVRYHPFQMRIFDPYNGVCKGEPTFERTDTLDMPIAACSLAVAF
jgi:hypothetical protein